MTSAEIKNTATTYANANDYQVQHGSKLLESLRMTHGHGLKVLDMGCGTDELTSVIVNQVGSEGKVVGVDPDEDRIKVAVERHGRRYKNISFAVADGSSYGHHLNEEYYDVHFSNFVIQWLTAKEKEVFANTAFKSLKPGGRIAIQSHEKNPVCVTELYKLASEDDIRTCGSRHFYLVDKAVIESVLEKVGFVILSSDYVPFKYTFHSVHEFITCCCASDYVDEKKISPQMRKAFASKFANEDGTLTFFEPSVYQIHAQKSECSRDSVV